MPEEPERDSIWARAKQSRIAQVLIGYLAVSWGILRVTEILRLLAAGDSAAAASFGQCSAAIC